MAPATLRSRFVLGASTAAIIGTAALAQTPPPAPAPAAPAAPAYPPTATITTPGYPGVGAGRFRSFASSVCPTARRCICCRPRSKPRNGAGSTTPKPPVLRVKSGDTIVLETMMHSHNQVVPGTTIEQIKKTAHRFSRPRAAHADRTDLYRGSAAGRRAQGDGSTRSFRAPMRRTSTCRACSASSRTSIRTAKSNICISTSTSMTTEFLPGVVLPLRPFPGTLGVARKEPGRYSSVPPGEFAGNMDIRDFVAGTSLYVPVHVPGALLWTGDSHAGQGNGEVNLTAHRDRLQGIQHHGGSHQGQAARLPAHRDGEVLDHHGLRPGPEQGLGAGQGANRQVPLPSSAASLPSKPRN